MEEEIVIKAKDILCLVDGMIVGVEKADSAIFSYSHIAQRMILFIKSIQGIEEADIIDESNWRKEFFDFFVNSSYFPKVEDYDDHELEIAINHYGEGALEVEMMVLEDEELENQFAAIQQTSQTNLANKKKGELLFKLIANWLLNERKETKEIKKEQFEEALEDILLSELTAANNTRAFHFVQFS